MKKVNKKLLALLMSATLVTAGAGAFVAFNGVDEGTSISASAEITTDRTATCELQTAAVTGDYKDAALIRIVMATGCASTSWGSGCFNDGAQDLLAYITINGKSIKEYRDEYAALIASGAESTITWRDYPDNGAAYPFNMQPNIVNDVMNKRATYAPIFVSATHHSSIGEADALDIYVPTSFLPANEIGSVGLKAGFAYNGYGVTEDVTFYLHSTRKDQVVKIVGNEHESYATTETDVYKLMIKNGFVVPYLTVNDYEGTNHEAGQVQLKNLATLNFYDYVEFNGNKLRSYMAEKLAEVYFQVWSEDDGFGFRHPSSIDVNSLQEVKFLKGCQFPSYAYDKQSGEKMCYQLENDVTFKLIDGVWVNMNRILNADNVQAEGKVAGDANELYQVTVDFPTSIGKAEYDLHYGFNNPNHAGYPFFQHITINGVNASEINVNTDDSNYTYATFPSANHEDTDNFQRPVLLHVVGDKTSKSLEIRIHKDYIEGLGLNEVDIKLTTGLMVNGYYLEEDVTLATWKKPINVTIDGVAQEGLVYGDKVAKPEDPTKEEAGYTCTFDNWYVVGTDTVYDFETVLEKDVAIESRFNKEAIEYTYTLVINPMDRMGGTQFVTAKYGEALVVEDPTAEGKEFLGWVDVEGNAVTLPETMPVDGGTVYASWKITAYELKIVNGDSEKVITFGVVADPDNGVEAAITDNDSLAFMLAGELPEEDDSYTYAWAEALPETFELKNYTFTVVATPKFVEVELGLGETTVEIPAGKFAVSYVPMGEYTVSWTGDATVTLGGAPVESGSVVTVTPRGGNVVITPNGEEACTVVFTVAIYEEPVTELVVGENAINVTVVNNYCAGTEVEFTAVEAGKYVLKVAEGEENADVTLIEENEATWIEEMPYEFELEAGATIKFVIATSNVMLTEDEINLVLEKVEEPAFVEVELGLGETTVEIPAGKFAVSYVPMGEYTVSWTGDATVTLGGAPVESGSVVTVTPRGGNVVITPNGEEACTVVFTVAIYEEPVTELVVGENAINVTVVNNYCAGTEVEFTAVEAGKYVLKVAEGEENADVTLIEENEATWIEEMPYEFELEAGATIKFVIATSNVMLTEDEINLVLEKVEEVAPPTSEEPEVPGDSEEPEVPGDSEEPVVPGDSEEPEVPGDSEEPVDSSEPEEEGKKKKKGCGSSLGLGMAGALTAVGAALVIKKRKED